MLSGEQVTDRKDGLVAVAYAPCEVRTLMRGVEVHLVEETEYPFKGPVRITVNPASPVRFPLRLRIPGWASGARLVVNGKEADTPQPSTFAEIDRTWQRNDRVELTLPMVARTTQGSQKTVSIERGPLVFSLPIGEDWVKLRERGMTADWQVFPTTQWNYALKLRADSEAEGLEVVEGVVGKMPFSRRGPQVNIKAKGRKVPAWIADNGFASPPPEGAVMSSQEEETLTLIPYACAKLRITAFPGYDTTAKGSADVTRQSALGPKKS